MKFDVIKYRFVFLIISLAIIIGGIVYGISTGFKFDIDFKGGTRIRAELCEEYNEAEISSMVEEIIGEKPTVQAVTGGNNAVTITTNIIEVDKSNEIVEALKAKYTSMTEEPTVRNVQASYGKELVSSTVKAVIFAIILILIYVIIRFRTLGADAAITAVIALVHDALIIVAIYAIFHLTINTSFVAVILTIIGYSINDTIVVYDRIRENRRKVNKSSDMKDVINTSIAQTFKRTINTSITTLGAILIVLVLAYVNNQATLVEFAFPLSLGVLFGTYSSICIASPLWYTFDSIFGKIKKRK